MRSLLTVVAALCIFLALGYGLFHYFKGVQNTTDQLALDPKDYRNSTYTIEGQPVTLHNGSAETEIVPGSAAKQRTQYFGNEVRKDLNGDGREDVAFLLTEQSGGSGVFYYLVAALQTDAGYQGSRGVFIGDRIAPQTTESGPGTAVIVNYADRTVDQSFTDAPTVGKSITFIFDATALVFSEASATGAAVPDALVTSLTSKTWQWDTATDAAGSPLTLKNPAAFSVTFKTDGTFGATTDCNGVGGNYVAGSSSIQFNNVAATQMYCEGAEESRFIELLTKSTTYHMEQTGTLLLDLSDRGGTVRFR